MFVGANPLTGITKSVSQFQRGSNELLVAIEHFNATMGQINEVASRVNRLLDDVEPPIRALMPQITRTLRSADTLVEQMSVMPKDLSEFMGILGDVARRLQPLAHLAESAGGMFGLKGLSGLSGLGGLLPGGGGPRPADPPPPPPAAVPAPVPAQRAATKKAPAKSPAKATAKKATAKKATARKATGTRKAAAPKSAAGKAS